MKPPSHHGKHPGTALLVGTDEILLYTRRALLEKQGFTISIVDPRSAAQLLETSSFDVIIACHTLKSREAQDLVVAAREMPSPPALISFSKQIVPEETAFPFDATIWSLTSPDNFIHGVHEVLERKQSTPA